MHTEIEVPQWRKALNKGNGVRAARAEYKRDLKTRRKTSRDLLLDPPDLALDVPIVELLTWIPGVQRVRAGKILRGIVFDTSMPIRRLSPRTRERLYSQVEHYRPTYGVHQGLGA